MEWESWAADDLFDAVSEGKVAADAVLIVTPHLSHAELAVKAMKLGLSVLCDKPAGAWRGTWDGEGGGILLNQCPHNLDLLQWICGMPVSVQAFCNEGKYHDITLEDEVTAYQS